MRMVRKLKNWRSFFFALALWVGIVPFFAAFSHACGCRNEQPCACCQTETGVQEQSPSSCCKTQAVPEPAQPACCASETHSTSQIAKNSLASSKPDTHCGDCHFCNGSPQIPDLNRNEPAKIVYPQGAALLPACVLEISLLTRYQPFYFSEQANHSPPVHNLSPRAPPFFLLFNR